MSKRLINSTVLGLLVLISGLQAQTSSKQDTLKELLRRVDILTEEIEKAKLGEVADVTYVSHLGMGPAASKIYQLTKTGISIAGYGEIVYNNFSGETDNGTPSGAADQIDYLRHITYLGFRFNDWLLFNSEIEFEHGKTGEGSPGEVAIEFGYIEAMFSKSVNLRAGMLLIPVGIINELHEPATFHGALRPETERRVIPSTWRANGFGLVGETNSGIGYKVYVTESLAASGFSSNGVRSGRQNGAQAIAENMALSGRLNYTGVAGLNVGASFFAGKTGQTLVDTNGDKIDAMFNLFALHAMYARRGLELRGLFAQSSLDDVSSLNAALGLSGTQSVGEKQRGFYVMAAYDLLPMLINNTTHYLAPFIQFESFDTQAEVPAGFTQNPARDRSFWTFGLTYKPHPNVAFKFDYLNKDNDADSEIDQFNLAVNYLF